MLGRIPKQSRAEAREVCAPAVSVDVVGEGVNVVLVYVCVLQRDLALILCAIVEREHRSLDSHDAIGGGPWLEVEWFERVADLHDKFASF